jgi:hypothetical protein
MTPAWPTYTGAAQLVGTTSDGRITVYIDPTLGQQGLENAQDLVADADRVARACDAIFGRVGGPADVIISAISGMTDGTGGANHLGCDFVSGSVIEICASFGNSVRVSALLAAMLSECNMSGNLCGVSTGEALSRWCAAVVSNDALADFVTAPQWFSDGMPNWVDQTEPTDSEYDSVGCGMAFISWLLSQGQSLSAIAQAMVTSGSRGTLAQLYATLTSDDAANAWPSFQAAVREIADVTSDDPFNSRINATLVLEPSGIQPDNPWPRAGSSDGNRAR